MWHLGNADLHARPERRRSLRAKKNQAGPERRSIRKERAGLCSPGPEGRTRRLRIGTYSEKRLQRHFDEREPASPQKGMTARTNYLVRPGTEEKKTHVPRIRKSSIRCAPIPRGEYQLHGDASRKGMVHLQIRKSIR